MVDGHYTGIPSQTTSLPNEQTYNEQYAAWASPLQIFTYIFAGFDEAWKSEPGGVGPYWGLYTEAGVAKWVLGQVAAVDPGITLWLSTNSAYGDLAFNGGTLLTIDPRTAWGNGFNIAAGTTSTLDNGGNLFAYTGTLSGSGDLTPNQGRERRFFRATAPASREPIPSGPER